MSARSTLPSLLLNPLRTALVLALLLAPALASARTYAFPHVFESKGVAHSSTNGTTFGAADVELVSLMLTTSSDSAVCNPCFLSMGSSSIASYTFDTTMFLTISPSSGGIPQEVRFFDIWTEIRLTNSSLPGDPVQTFDTEMLSLSLTAPGPVLVRESPSLPSLGRYTSQPLPSGEFNVDSFFDIWTELSLDGGQTWTPADAPLHLELTAVPEPSTALLAGLGLLGLGACRRRPSRSC